MVIIIFVPIHQIFLEVSDLFSQAEVPLIYKVIPMLEDMEHALENVRNDASLPDVIRVAAHAALLTIGKYYALTDDCEVYRIAMGMFSHASIFGF